MVCRFRRHLTLNIVKKKKTKKMKKTIFTTLLLLGLISISFNSMGSEDRYYYEDEYEEYSGSITTLRNWTFLQIALWPGVPGVTRESNVCGLKLGIPMSDGNGYVNGMELGVVSASTSHIAGFQFSSFLNTCKELYGAQFSMVNLSSEACYGFQAGLVNINSNDNGGLQIAAANIAKESFSGVQIGTFNTAKAVHGLQMGIVNTTDECGLQFGLVNIISNGWLPFCILFNFSF